MSPYADQLREMFRGLNPALDDLLLLEAHQIASLPKRAPARQLAAVLHAHPRLPRFFVARHPPIEAFLAELLAQHGPVSAGELKACEYSVVWELADWIVYQREPALYDAEVGGNGGLAEIDDAVDLGGKVVIDAGAGTGCVAFAVAPRARHVYAVEPVAALRRYMREKASRLAVENLFVLDGFLDAVPLPANTADVLLTRKAIGWRLGEELAEIERLVKPNGIAMHVLGAPDPAEPVEALHEALVADGYEARYSDTLGRNYLKRLRT